MPGDLEEPSSLRVALIQGGPSSEAEVSRVSAAAVQAALRDRGHEVVALECDRELAAILLSRRFDVVFPVAHGRIGEDGCLQGMLEVLALPYVGSAVLASALANDKRATKMACRAAGLPVAEGIELTLGEPLSEQAARAVSRLGTDLVVKPASQGSAIGVSLLPGLEGASDPRLMAALNEAYEYDPHVVVEQLVRGREITCGVLDIPSMPAMALPPTEIRARAASWYDFRSKYGSGGSEHLCPAPLSPQMTRRVQELALATHRAIGARDMSRTDFIVVDDDDAHAHAVILELNTLPGMTSTSLFPEAAAKAEIPFVQLCDGLVRAAYRRGVAVAPRVMPFPEGRAAGQHAQTTSAGTGPTAAR